MMEVTMKKFILLLLVGLHCSQAVIHSMKYFDTASSGLRNFPEYVVVGQLDGVEMLRYDSNTRRAQPKQDWINKITEEEPHYWDTQTQINMANQQVSKTNIETAKQRFNQSGVVHMVQRMFGCEWDDETGDTTDGFMQYAFDGEDFIAFDLKTQTWVAAKQQALTTKLRWDNDRALTTQQHNYLSTVCPEWGKKYLNYASRSLLRTEVPSVFLLQRNTSYPISCMATGFFPDRAVLFWTKDGEELHEGVDIGESLPNHDGTFQTSADLDPPPHEDWHRYQCVFQLSGLKKDLITTLDKAAVKSNSDKGGIIPIVLAVISALLLLGFLFLFLVYMKKETEIWRALKMFLCSQLRPLAALSTEEKKKSSHGTLMQAAGSGSDSASSSSDDAQAPTEIKVPLMEGAEQTPPLWSEEADLRCVSSDQVSAA